MADEHKMYMQRAIELANRGKHNVSPNPRVGAVIVHNNEIIGEGFHSKYGGPHAEVNAINSVIEKDKLKHSTIYVNLEPCSHFGKTPPCSDLIIEKEIPEVVIANKDPFEQVNGSGIDNLRAHGVKVIEGVLENEAKFLNRRFFTFHTNKRPYIILKWAETSDGFISRNLNDPLIKDDNWISSKSSKKLVHKWRSEEDAILVGTKTAAIDNPELTVREVNGKNPTRVVIDRDLSLKSELKVFNTDSRTIVFNAIKEESIDNIEYQKIDFNRPNSLKQLLDSLYQKNIQSLIVEGGAHTLNLFLKYGEWDEIRQFISIKKFQSGIKAPIVNLKPFKEKEIGTDKLLYYYKH